ncbi:LysR family transcriptional regulator [Marisediminitalea sp.]|jgi:DNA-binding transcriptional LysR family regulator|uniref:LysR family transcriptional regulator n=1 Tax=Marisediminitalea sp. TaxID=2662268 RepID=UPI003513E090
MTLEQLRMFVTVADLGSIARAAEHLHKTQPAISIAIKRLQDEFNLSLLQKSGNCVFRFT